MKYLPVVFLVILFVGLGFTCTHRFATTYHVEHKIKEIDAKTIPEGDNVWYIGDSYTDNDYMKAKVQEVFGDIFVDVQSGKRFARDWPYNPAGTTLLRKYVATGRKPTYLIYELLANDPDRSTEEAAADIAEVREILGPDVYIIFMTGHCISRNLDSFNTAIWRAAAEDDRILVADWQGAIQGKEEQYISYDLLHPNDAGHDLLAKLFKEQLDKAVEMARK